jgi:hypothetical protein
MGSRLAKVGRAQAAGLGGSVRDATLITARKKGIHNLNSLESNAAVGTLKSTAIEPFSPKNDISQTFPRHSNGGIAL